MNKIMVNEVEYTYPESWDEVTFGMWEDFQGILTKRLDSEDMYSYDTMIDVMVNFTGVPRDVFINSPKSFFERVFMTIKFLWDDELSTIKYSNRIQIDGEWWVANEDPNITFGEWIDRDAVLEHYPADQKMSAMVAILLRPQGLKYNPDDLKTRQEKIKRQPVKNIFPLLSFFLTKKNLLLQCLTAYSQMLELYRMRILELETYQKNGGGNTSFMKWRAKILPSLIQYLKDEYTKSSTTLYTYMTRISQARINSELTKL